MNRSRVLNLCLSGGLQNADGFCIFATIYIIQALREQTPTLAELKDKAKSTKADIDKCAAAAEYGRAGSLQVRYSLTSLPLLMYGCQYQIHASF